MVSPARASTIVAGLVASTVLWPACRKDEGQPQRARVVVSPALPAPSGSPARHAPEPGGAIGSPAPAKATASDAELAELLRAVADERSTPHVRLRAVEAFVSRHQKGHAHAEQVEALLETQRAEVKREEEAQVRRASAYLREVEARKEAEERQAAKLQAAFRAAKLPELRDEYLWRMAKLDLYGPTREPIPEVALTFAGDAARVTKPVWFGPAGARYGFVDLVRGREKEMVGPEAEDEDPVAVNALLDEVLGERLSRRLYVDAGRARMDPRALDELLQAVYVRPDERILGVRASLVYRLYREPVANVARVYAQMLRVGPKAVVRDFRSAYKRYPDTPENRRRNDDMLQFYADWTAKHRIAEKGGFGAGHFGTEVIVGMWMRRMADGSHEVIGRHLKKLLHDYDPALAVELGLVAVEASP